MRIVTATLLATLLFVGSAPAQAPDDGAVPKNLEGRWIVAHRYYTPSDVTNPVGDLLTSLGSILDLKKEKLSACDPAKKGVYLTVKFEPGKTPPAVDLKAPGQEQVLRGIYRLDGDVLRIAVGTGKRRPRTFDDPSRDVQLIMKRAPKKAPAAAPSSP